ncbi:hypothetical protein N2603_23365 [Bradyrhizobium huanghuaihaiense]|uniref:hypothetical protein n=1 Tax=Bradyrhizobium huanghuaihaiense TaxID=990078 RepID=UPI0021A9CF98|nr:hypothetical protein [Bradyrhizobium sp. CB3035]UWU73046.1 hypothetical protein N2603_23365 [Bradyrhizobium sp. CB3035]
MPSASQVYAARRAAREARATTQPPSVAVSRPSLDAAAIYARRRQEAQQHGREAGYFS